MSTLIVQNPTLPRLRIDCRARKVHAVSWMRTTGLQESVLMDGPAHEQPLLKRLLKDMKDYFEGKSIIFDWPFDWDQGTAFEQAVWQTIRKVPYGETRSYQWVAEMIGRPRAVRAVGNANGKNPFSLVVPCHRIIKSDGSIGGYTGGLSIKRKLLAHEKTNHE